MNHEVDNGVNFMWMNLFWGDFIVKQGEGQPCLGIRFLRVWTELWNEVTKILARCAFSRNEHDSSTLGELVHERMTKRSKHICTSRFEVKHLDIVEDLLDKCWTTTTIVR
jgi:hypothetical protein